MTQQTADDSHDSASTETDPYGGESSPAPTRLRVDARSTERTDRFVALATSPTPRLSWTVPLRRDGQAQTAFEATVHRHPREDTPVWSSGPVAGTDPWVRVDHELAAHERLWFTVRCRDENGAWSDWARRVPLETGPHALADWAGASWVASPALDVLRREFSVAGGAVERARLHVTAQGLVRATVNGAPVNPDASDPSRTDASRALFRTYDVTDLIRAGDNTLDLALGHGEWERSGLDPRVLAGIVVVHEDGSRSFHGTGPGMLSARGPVAVEQPFYLEAHDATRMSGFAEASLDLPSPALSPESLAAPPATVAVDPGPPLHAVQSIAPTLAGVPSPGVRLYDAGVNVAGRTRLTVTGTVPAGTVVQVVHGEHVTTDGRLDTTNLTMPFDHGRVRQAVTYTLENTPAEPLEPWFCYHGFRYVEVSGLPDGVELDVEVVTLHSDLEPTGRLSSDAPAVDSLFQRGKRTLLNNVHGIPEDCPTREQSGWTGDTASVTEFEFSAFDMQAFFTKWLGDLRTSQQPDGAIPAIAPDIREQKAPADPVWGAALQRVLEGSWLHYGDLTVVRDHLPALRAWVDYQLSCATDEGIIGLAPISYGHDWLALEQTPPELHHTSAALDALRVLADFERLIGEPDAAARRMAQAEALRQAARTAFVDSERDRSRLSIGNGSQASLAIAVANEWLDENEAAIAVARIDADIRARGNRVSSGFATTRTLVRTLAGHGRSQALFDALHQPAEPGIGAMIDHGPGTFWECWWIDPENTGTGSLDHIGLGGPFAGWAWQFLAGVRPIAGGYSRFVVEPHLVDGLTEIDLSTETVRGLVEVRWRHSGSQIELNVTVPVGAEAVIRLPGAARRLVGAGRHTFAGEVTTPVAVIPPRAPAWQAPAWAPLSGDVDGDAGLVQAAIEHGGYRAAGSTSEIEVLEHGVRCMPVPHAQIPGPILRVRGTDPLDTEGPLARLEFSEPLDLTDARFAFAMFDLCLENSSRPMRTVLRLISADSSTREASERLWPAGWMRATVALDGWEGASDVVAVEAGLQFLDDSDASDVAFPAAFHLGQVGFSRIRRTWP